MSTVHAQAYVHTSIVHCIGNHFILKSIVHSFRTSIAHCIDIHSYIYYTLHRHPFHTTVTYYIDINFTHLLYIAQTSISHCYCALNEHLFHTSIVHCTNIHACIYCTLHRPSFHTSIVFCIDIHLTHVLHIAWTYILTCSNYFNYHLGLKRSLVCQYDVCPMTCTVGQQVSCYYQM